MLPGDIVAADSHGVVVIPRRDAEAVLAKAQAVARAEEEKIVQIQAGHARARLKSTLDQKGCEILEREWER